MSQRLTVRFGATNCDGAPIVRAAAAWIEGATEKTAAWDVGAVLSVAADAAGEELTKEILLQLPDGYDLLFGRPQAT